MFVLPRPKDELGDDHLEVLAEGFREERRDVPVHVQRLRGVGRALGARGGGVELEIVRARVSCPDHAEAPGSDDASNPP